MTLPALAALLELRFMDRWVLFRAGIRDGMSKKLPDFGCPLHLRWEFALRFQPAESAAFFTYGTQATKQTGRKRNDCYGISVSWHLP